MTAGRPEKVPGWLNPLGLSSGNPQVARVAESGGPGTTGCQLQMCVANGELMGVVEAAL